MTAGLTLARLVALFRTPLELYPDEAQYWLWSRTLDFGYYSKPPMVAWAIWATTHLGDAEALVRLSAPLFQGGATLAVFAIARKLYGGPAALAAAALYALMPAVQLSGIVVATDAPLLFFLGLSILAYVHLQPATGGRRLALAAGFGAALGLAFLSKYAAVYAVIGLALHLILSREARRAWSPAAAVLAAAVFAAFLAPNVVWNAHHGFATLHHTAANADWGGGSMFNPRGLASFLATQFGVFGPIPFGVLIAGLVLAARRKAMAREDLLLLCFILPPLAIVSVQAILSRANANWSGASYLPGAVLVAAWLTRWRARRWLTAAIAIQALLAAYVLLALVDPRVADATGGSNSLKRVRGWAASARLVTERARVEEDAGLSAVAVNNRFLYYALAYYGRDYFGQPGAPPLTYWLRTGKPANQAESNAPLNEKDGVRVLAVSYEGWLIDEMTGDFSRVLGREIDSVWLDRKHKRKLVMFIGQGFRPAPRDPKTGIPLQRPPQTVLSTASRPQPTR
ncbi:ArnT family glycosyltransferase [Phenylobacterium soli]|uniref:ArnT family glycosyltransferase n=1 Tax=Phenylobacterium soli TaxID=2170551 RepID=UPI001D04CCD8|nr:glycosyltransferase family 39 protein [Phenylobacterium soli]